MTSKLPKNFEQFNEPEKAQWIYSQECLDNIKNAYELTPTNKPHIKNFVIINSKVNPAYFSSWKIGHEGNSFRLCLVKFDIIYNTTGYLGTQYKHQDSHMYFFGHLTLKKDCGIGLIRPETVLDKLNELFEPIELDIKTHPVFSYRYFVMTDDKTHFSKALSKEFLDFTQNISGLQIEFRNHQCLFRLRKAIDKVESFNLCKIGLTLDHILNNPVE